jgi:hypothetical protein|tara:strand:- start:6598 stop:7938 length:1341 start_codon:yes stop_codon:yes gene_type:complete
MTDLSEAPTTVDERNQPIREIMGSQAVAPVLPTGTTFVGAGQTAQPGELIQTPEITGATPATVATAQTPAQVATPTTLTTPTITAKQIGDVGVAQAATQVAPTQTIISPQGTVSEQAIPVAATQDLDEKATIQYQLGELYNTIEEGKPLPPWASGAARGASQVMQQRGLGASSMAAAAIAQSVLESALPIAAGDAQAQQRIQLQNLSNQQSAALQKAATFAQMDTANLNARLTSAVNNAKNFLSVDLQNLSNTQASNTISYNGKLQEMFTDASQENATRQLNAKNQIQVEEFFAQLGVQVEEANANRVAAVDQFNAGQTNSISTFNAELSDSRDRFNANMRAQIDQSNAQWRRQINTQNTATQNEVNRANAQALLGLSVAAQNNLWQQYRDEAAFVIQTTEAAVERAHQAALLAQRGDINKDLQYSANFGKAIGAVGGLVFDKLFN